MSKVWMAAPTEAENLTRELERVLVDRQRIIECGAALTATGRCCTPAHTPVRLAHELAALLARQKGLLVQLAAVLPPATPPARSV
jgi:hypothetical protein